MPRCRTCKGETNSPDGICSVCKVENNYLAHLGQKAKEENRVNKKAATAEGTTLRDITTKRRAKKPTSEAVESQAGKGTQKKRSMKGEKKDTLLLLDFSKHPDVLERIEELADKEIRRPEGQALILLIRLLRDGENVKEEVAA